MSNRRRAGRFLIPDRAEGVLRLMQDAYIEHAAPDVITVVTESAVAREEEHLLELPPERGHRSVLAVVGISCSPVRLGGSTRYRVDLQITRPAYTAIATLRDVITQMRPAPRMGVLIRRVSLRVLDVSTIGCLVESGESLTEGAVGILELPTTDPRTIEPLRICRSVRMAGGSPRWRCGAEFLPLNAPVPTSVRNLVARLEIVMRRELVAEAFPPAVAGD